MYRIRPIDQIGVKSSARTRAALIRAAASAFRASGFESARIRNIVRLARTSLSAVDYHFGNKLDLYCAVLQDSIRELSAGFPFDDKRLQQSPRQHLYSLVQNFLYQLRARTAEKSPLIPLRDIFGPPEAVDVLAREYLAPQLDGIRSAVMAVLDGKVPAEAVNNITLSLFSQCLFYGLTENVHASLMVKAPESSEEISSLAMHIVNTSVAGLMTE
ncbi:MAG: CerR family C-terminal domain-containing protein [Pedobacter sp.]|nr:CerR family C-terminal domain-containing protein [Pedobacter sp.]